MLYRWYGRAEKHPILLLGEANTSGETRGDKAVEAVIVQQAKRYQVP